MTDEGAAIDNKITRITKETWGGKGLSWCTCFRFWGCVAWSKNLFGLDFDSVGTACMMLTLFKIYSKDRKSINSGRLSDNTFR